jgi:hypothetical protein
MEKIKMKRELKWRLKKTKKLGNRDYKKHRKYRYRKDIK